MEDGAIIEIVDVHKIAHLLLLLDLPHALSCHKDTGETVLVIVGPLLPSALSRVEESCHAGFAGVGGLYHHGIRASPNPWYGIYVFLP